MRRPPLAAVLVFAALAANLQTSIAQESFFSRRYCTRSSALEGGLDCRFSSWEQCMATARGMSICTENPWWRDADQPRATGRRGVGKGTS